MGELTTTTKGAVAELSDTNWAMPDINPQNILSTRLYLMQGLSELVSEGKAKLGDIVKSTTGEIVCPKGEAIEMLPLMVREYWLLFKRVGGKYEFSGVESLAADNINGPLDFVRDGLEYKRDRSLDVYMLLKADIRREAEALKKVAEGMYPDPDDCLMPVVVSFRRTSFRAGKEIITQCAKAAAFSAPPFTKSILLSAEVEKNDSGTYAVFKKIAGGTMSTVEELKVCKKWYDIIHQTNAKPPVIDPEANVVTVDSSEERAKF